MNYKRNDSKQSIYEFVISDWKPFGSSCFDLNVYD